MRLLLVPALLVLALALAGQHSLGAATPNIRTYFDVSLAQSMADTAVSLLNEQWQAQPLPDVSGTACS